MACILLRISNLESKVASSVRAAKLPAQAVSGLVVGLGLVSQSILSDKSPTSTEAILIN